METKPIGRRLAEARRESGLSQDEAAKRLGVSRQSVSRVERSRSIRTTTLRRYAQIYGVSTRVLATWISEEVIVDAA